MSRECLDYGAKIVGGVTPGRGGRDVYGIPVYDTVRAVTAKTRVDGSVVAVPPAFKRDAVYEALEADLKLIVVVTERIPRHEVAQMVEWARMRGARIIGPNCLGVLSPGEAKMGGLGGRAEDARKAFTKGPIGVMSRSGGMTTEMCNTLTAAGFGQSTAVSIGGDAMIGSTYADLMPLYEADPETKAIVIYCEPGGRMEARAGAVRRRARVAAADRGVHGRPVHGRDARHALRPRRHDRRRQSGHDGGKDQAPRSCGHFHRRAHRGHSGVGEEAPPRPPTGEARTEATRRGSHGPVHRSRSRPGLPPTCRRQEAHRGVPGQHLRPRPTARCRSSTRTSTSAPCASCASTPRRRAR